MQRIHAGDEMKVMKRKLEKQAEVVHLLCYTNQSVCGRQKPENPQIEPHENLMML